MLDHPLLSDFPLHELVYMEYKRVSSFFLNITYFYRKEAENTAPFTYTSSVSTKFANKPYTYCSGSNCCDHPFALPIQRISPVHPFRYE